MTQSSGRRPPLTSWRRFGYTGVFPIKVSGEFMDNLSPSSENKAWRAGVTFGKAGRKNTWEVNYRYQRLEADAWFDALVDDDNGAFYAGNKQLAFRGAGKDNGWLGGTNVKGHQVVATYSFTDSLNFTFIYYLNELIIANPSGPASLVSGSSSASHFMADLNWKF